MQATTVRSQRITWWYLLICIVSFYNNKLINLIIQNKIPRSRAPTVIWDWVMRSKWQCVMSEGQSPLFSSNSWEIKGMHSLICIKCKTAQSLRGSELPWCTWIAVLVWTIWKMEDLTEKQARSVFGQFMTVTMHEVKTIYSQAFLWDGYAYQRAQYILL